MVLSSNERMNSPHPSIVFVAGVHGVGKTTFTQKISTKLGVPTFSAGSLINSHRDRIASADKRVANVAANQDVLVEAVHSLALTAPLIILDGHFCVRDKSGAVNRIPLTTYESLNIRLAIILHEDPEVIQDRLYGRDGTNHTSEDIAVLQTAEIDHGTKIAKQNAHSTTFVAKLTDRRCD
jgi:adenylate kinase